MIVPAVSKSIRRPFIDAEVFRVGELKAMVDSGAKNSAISEGMLLGRSGFAVLPPSKYSFIDGTLMDNVIGEASLTIRYKGTVVDLEKVAVVRGMLYPLLLGVEWIVKSDAMIKGVEGVARVIMPSELNVGQNRNVEKIEQVRPADTQNSVRESSTIEQEIDSEYVQVTEELKTMGDILGAEVSAASSDPLSETTFVLEPVPSVIPAVCIPVINANPHSIGRRSARAILKATPIEENDIHLLTDSRDVGEEIVGMVQPHDGTSQPDDTLNDVTIDPRLTPLEVDIYGSFYVIIVGVFPEKKVIPIWLSISFIPDRQSPFTVRRITSRRQSEN